MAKGKYEKWLEPDGLLLIEGWARQGLSDEQIADNMGVGSRTLYTWKSKYQQIRQSLKKGKQVADFQVENALFKRATGFTSVEETSALIDDKGQNKRHAEVQDLTEDEWEFAVAYFSDTCAYCGKQAALTKDHLDPLNNNGTLDRTNVVPACQSCNSSKKDHQWLSWYGKQKFYDEKRASKITDYVKLMLRLPQKKTEPKLTIIKRVTKEVPPDTGAAIFWLKTRDPKHWRENYDLYQQQVKQTKAEAELSEEQVKSVKGDDGAGEVVIVDDIPENETKD